jgi:membrane-associated protein
MLVHFGGLLDPTGLLVGAGPFVVLAIMAIIFIETGLLFPFLPGDSLVFTAALLTTRLNLPLPVLMLAVAVAAILGDQVGYLIGRRFGSRLFKPDARILKTQYLDRSDAFFQKYGGRALVLARFVPIVRTFLPPIVGMSTMPYRRFLLWNALGGLAWAIILSLAGFWLGKIPFVADNVDLIAVVIIAVSVIPVAINLLRRRHSTLEPRESATEEPSV